MVQERFQSIISQLFQHRTIRCGGPVDDDMANIIVAQLLYLDAVDPTKDIVMYVNSPGGSVTAGMAIFDTMRPIRPNVSTVCVGLAASMGAFILSSGAKGKRFSLPNSRIMIHQPLGGAQRGQTDIDIQANEMLHHKAKALFGRASGARRGGKMAACVVCQAKGGTTTRAREAVLHGKRRFATAVSFPRSGNHSAAGATAAPQIFPKQALT